MIALLQPVRIFAGSVARVDLAARAALARRAFPHRRAGGLLPGGGQSRRRRRRACSRSATASTNTRRNACCRSIPVYLAGMNLVVLADDAFTFLVSWEFMSLTSWALVIAHHRISENLRAGYVYLLMASFGTLALLLAFGLLAGADGNYAFDAMRAVASVDAARRAGADPRAGRRRLEGRRGAAACLAAARASGRAQPRLRADERRDDQGRGLRLRAHRVRSARAARLVVEHRSCSASAASPR